MFDMIAEAFDRAMKEVVVRRQAEARPDFEGIAGPTRFCGYAVQLQARELDGLTQVSGEGTWTAGIVWFGVRLGHGDTVPRLQRDRRMNTVRPTPRASSELEGWWPLS